VLRVFACDDRQLSHLLPVLRGFERGSVLPGELSRQATSDNLAAPAAKVA
jgi:hypothetical protein